MGAVVKGEGEVASEGGEVAEGRRSGASVRSATISVVPSSSPSETQSSMPFVPSSAVKNNWLETGVSDQGEPDPSGLIS